MLHGQILLRISSKRQGQKTLFNLSYGPLQGPETRTCPFASPLFEFGSPVIRWKEMMWAARLNLSFWLIFTMQTNKTSSKERFNRQSMSKMLHPINTRTTFGWKKVGDIWVKLRNCLKIKGRGRRSPVANCSLLKYIALWDYFSNDKYLSSTKRIEILFEIQKQARNSCSNRRSTRHSDLRRPAQGPFRPPFKAPYFLQWKQHLLLSTC